MNKKIKHIVILKETLLKIVFELTILSDVYFLYS